MNPFDEQAEQSRYNIVTIQNVDSEPFLIEYDSSNPMTRYVSWMQPGEVRRLPKFIASHAVKHMIDQVLNRMDKPVSHATLRLQFAEKIIVGEERVSAAPVLSPDQIAVEKIDEYNRPTDLEAVLAKRKDKPAEESVVPEVPLVEEKPVVKKVVEKTEPKPVPTDNDEDFVGLKPASLVSREKLYTYATKTLGMDLDKKTLNKFQNMSDDELAVELDYPTEE